MALFPLPSALCSEDSAPSQFHQRNCARQGLTREPPWWYTHPGRPDPRQPYRDPRFPAFGNTPGFNFGLLLLPYVLDWGDTTGIMTRRKAYVSVLKSYPFNRDRAFALASVNHFVNPADMEVLPFYDFLCLAKPFAGWRWQAQALRTWMRFARDIAQDLGGPRSLGDAAALQAGLDWCLAVRPEWERLAVDHFPYGPLHMSDYWSATSSAAP